MRTATNETRRQLAAAINGGSQRAWAIAQGVKPVDVSDCLHNKPMSARRENRLRIALGLAPLRWQVVELLDGQHVVTDTPARINKRRAFTTPPDITSKLDIEARKRGFRSAGAWALANILREIGID